MSNVYKSLSSCASATARMATAKKRLQISNQLSRLRSYLSVVITPKHHADAMTLTIYSV